MATSKNRVWGFSVSNYQYEDLFKIVYGEHKWQYICFGLEMDNGGFHCVRGFLYYKNPVSKATLDILFENVKRPGTNVETFPTKLKLKKCKKILSKQGQFYEYGLKPVQGKKAEEQMIPTIEIINEEVKHSIEKLMNYPCSLTKIVSDGPEKRDKINIIQAFRYLILHVIEQQLRLDDYNKTLPGVNDYNFFNSYIMNQSNGICCKTQDSVRQAYFDRFNKDYDHLIFDMVKHADYLISKPTKDYLVELFGIITNKKFSYKKETHLTKLKLYLLKLLFRVINLWKKNNPDHKVINDLNEILSFFDASYNVSEPFYSIASGLMYHSKLNTNNENPDIDHLMNLIEFCRGIIKLNKN